MVGLHLFKSSRLNPVADAVATALASARRSTGGLRRPLLVGLSAALLPAMGVAQNASDPGSPASRPTNPSDDGIEMVVVSARRQAIENATERKKNAESIVDSVVADDAGMLPDNSITEVLQRVSGVTISRFNDADHFSTEGNGIQVRGMSGVAARLNGREIFSANGGSGLSWGDVTPELMAAVDIYKSPTADQIEGGLGGQIDLRTKMPFDYEKGPQINGSMEGNYGDVAGAIDPSASALISNRWDTGIGEFGALLDLSYSKLQQKSNFIRMEPYYRTSLPDGNGGYMDRFIPGGFDYGFDEYERVRTGAYIGLQWKPTENLSLSQTAFYSRHETTGNGMGVFATAKQGFWAYADWGGGPKFWGGADEGGSNGLAVDPAVSTFDRNGMLLTTPQVFVRDPNTWGLSGNINTGGNSGYNDGESWTGEASTSFEWHVTERLAIQGAAQFVKSEVDSRGYDIFPQTRMPGTYSLDLTGDLPQVQFLSTPAVEDPVNTSWYAHMPNRQFNKGDMNAYNLDAEFSISEDGFFRTVRAGVRYADRKENDSGYYGWTNLCAGWDGCNPTTRSFDQSDAGDTQFQTFPDFFRGDANLPSGLWMPSLALARQFDPTAVDARYSGPAAPDANTQAHNSFQFIPTDSREQEIVNKSAYVMARFAAFENGAVPIDGNVGVRVVRIENTSSGYFDQKGMFATVTEVDENGNPVLDPNGNPVTIRENIAGIPNLFDGSLTRFGGTTTTRGLPSINLRLKPNESVQLRFAYGVTMDQPQFFDLRATGSVGANRTNNIFNGTFNADTGNPLLKPVISKNTDISLEWYHGSTSTHLSLFHKAITDALVYSSITRDQPVYLNDGTTTNILANRSEVANSDKMAKVKGFELGGRTFFDRLPAPWNGLGVEANYTYVDSESPGDLWQDIDGHTHDDAPMRGLSKNTYNLQLMFEKPKFGARLAWNWRSAYLLSTNTNGTNGDYTYFPTPNLGAANTIMPTFRDISLPTFSDEYGQLDFGASYRPTENLSVSMDFRNLLDEISRTYTTGYSNGQTNKYHEKAYRSWFISDRRVSLGVRYKF